VRRPLLAHLGDRSGPTCRGGDSGGPVFSGTVAFGIAKGANYTREGGCNFYFYMSTDYLPVGWTLATERTAIAAAVGNPDGGR